MFTKELVFVGNHLAFDAWPLRLTRVISEVVANFLHLALVSRHTTAVVLTASNSFYARMHSDVYDMNWFKNVVWW